MEKKEKSSEEKSLIKRGQMNKNMFNFIKTIPGIDVEMGLLNQIDPKNPDKFIPEYEITGKTPTFNFKISISEVDDYQVSIKLGNDVNFNLHNNSQLRFVLENYLPQPQIEPVIESTPESKLKSGK